jgi:hypothetical protein
LVSGLPTVIGPFVTFSPSQLSLSVKAPPTGENWAHNLKYEGVRFHVGEGQSRPANG